MAHNGEQILKIQHLSKRFGGVQALNHVNFDLNYGEVHALVGENGAGKSTLIKVLGGVHQRDDGIIIYEQQEVKYSNPAEAQHAGIAIIYQELSMMPSLTVTENIFMGQFSTRLGLVNWREQEVKARAVLEQVGLDINPNAIVRELSISQRQLIEIAKALAADARLIIMDEPNSSLSDAETELLFEVIEALKARGIAIIYVSHKIDEVLHISDRITVLRDGVYVNTIDAKEATENQVVNMMVGRELYRTVSIVAPSEDILLEVRNLTGKRFHDVSFTVQRGEIMGFAGLVGAGRSDVAQAIFGTTPCKSGEIFFEGEPVSFESAGDAIRHGVAMVQEDRKVLSLFMGMSCKDNIIMAELPNISRFGIINKLKEHEIAEWFVSQLDIRLSSLEAPVRSLSGGNQQKIVLARWLATKPKLLILDEPTHGVDVGAKAEIYQLMRKLAEEGVSIILISSELPEILAMSHRIVVMHEGRVTGIVHHSEATEDLLMTYATAVADEE